MSGFFGIGGKNSGQQNQAIGNLNNVFNYAMPTARNLVSAGTSGVSSALGRFQQMLSGNRSTIASTIAPSVNAAQTQTDAARRQADASGTARGGGIAPANATAKDASLAAIQNQIMGAQNAGAEGAAATGGQLLSSGQNLLGMGVGATGKAGDIASAARDTSSKEGLGWTSALLNFLTPGKQV